jgi:phosphoglycerol transferase MdoB-like AlkP superfamily enzyme
MRFFTQLGETDCEVIRDGFLLQPVNAISSLAFSVVGLLIAASAVQAVGHERRVRVVFGALLVLTGVGSFLFHGPQNPGSHFLHDITFLATVWFLAVMNLNDTYGWWEGNGWVAWLGGTGVLGILLIVFPASTNLLTAGIIVALVITDIAIQRKGGIIGGWYVAALVALVIAVGLMIAGRTGSPLCDPDSGLQAHGGWHLFVAVALGSYFMAMSNVRVAGRRRSVETA